MNLCVNEVLVQRCVVSCICLLVNSDVIFFLLYVDKIFFCYVLASFAMYDRLTPRGSIVWSSAAQTTDGKLRVRALGFHLVLCPAWGVN